MANVIINDTNLSNIANAIRSKNGSNETYKPSEMAAAISALAIGGGINIDASNLAIVDVSTSYANTAKLPDLSSIVNDFSQISIMFWGCGYSSYLYIRGANENRIFFINTGSSSSNCSYTTPFDAKYHYLSGPVSALEVISVSASGSTSTMSKPAQFKVFVVYDEEVA